MASVSYLLVAQLPDFPGQSVVPRELHPSTIKTIGMDDVRSLSAAFPNLDEQNRIVEWVFSQIENLKSIIFEAEQTIALLQERRTALISAAVTGKIDVRDWVAPTQKQQKHQPEAAPCN